MTQISNYVCILYANLSWKNPFTASIKVMKKVEGEETQRLIKHLITSLLSKFFAQFFWSVVLQLQKERKFDASNVSNICTCEFNLIWGDNLNWLIMGYDSSMVLGINVVPFFGCKKMILSVLITLLLSEISSLEQVPYW